MKIKNILLVLLFAVLFISGCTITAYSEEEKILGMDDINNEINILNQDEEDFDLSDLENIEQDLGG